MYGKIQRCECGMMHQFPAKPQWSHLRYKPDSLCFFVFKNLWLRQTVKERTLKQDITRRL
jgi:hypothetical protein